MHSGGYRRLHQPLRRVLVGFPLYAVLNPAVQRRAVHVECILRRDAVAVCLLRDATLFVICKKFLLARRVSDRDHVACKVIPV